MASDKVRVDTLLVERGLAPGRDRAKALVMAGNVYINGAKTVKPGETVSAGSAIELRGGEPRYVSRGGLKLEKAINSFDLPVNGFVCADIGASTGGFTDCMLRYGAAHVFAVDVGYGQLDWRLRSDARVTVLERTNARRLTRDMLGRPVDLVSIDVSFISLRLILPAVRGILRDGGHVMCLVKPQFEAGRENVGKRGVVRDPQIHGGVIAAVAGYAAENGFAPLGLDYSPIKGPQGNIEYLLHLVRAGEERTLAGETVANVVEQAHKELSQT